jgi:CheY-like chemotaxis protein
MTRTSPGSSGIENAINGEYREAARLIEDSERDLLLTSQPLDRRSQVPLQILLAEDNPGDARLVREALTESKADQFELIHCTRLREGLERLQSGSIDVVLLDLGLPDSIDLQTLIRAHADMPTIHIIVLTGTDDEELGISAVRMGAQGYLSRGLSKVISWSAACTMRSNVHGRWIPCAGSLGRITGSPQR